MSGTQVRKSSYEKTCISCPLKNKYTAATVSFRTHCHIETTHWPKSRKSGIDKTEIIIALQSEDCAGQLLPNTQQNIQTKSQEYVGKY
jgi:hypothetical protein